MGIGRPIARKRSVALFAVGALVVGGLSAVTANSLAATSGTTKPFVNLADALQKSLYFYDAEKSGPAASTGHQPLEWRGDSEPTDSAVPLASANRDDNTKTSLTSAGTNLSAAFITANKAILDPDGDGAIDLSGGFHDAGDHVKFGLPQAYAASTIAWGVYHFEDAYRTTGTYDHVMEELRWFNDYFLRSTFRDKSGDVVAFNYMVGNGTIDHTYWGPPELQTNVRPATFATAQTPASDQAAGASAALTLMSLITAKTDPSYASNCLDTAKALYAFARKYRGLGNSDGFYGSSYDEDEMSWAAVWLYTATSTRQYLDDIVAVDATGHYTGYLKKIIAGPDDTWQNIWVQSWDTVWAGMFAQLAPISKGVVSETENAKYWYYFKWNLEYWTGGAVKHDSASDTNYMASTPAGFQVINTWGSARYNAAAQLTALVYRKTVPDDPKGEQLTNWALGQMNYITGDNPMKRAYIVGLNDTAAKHPHHRAAHGSMTNSMLDPETHRHTLWGALVGGPDSKDNHNDVTTDYVSNEVAIDYNAGLVGALAGLYSYYGTGSGQTVTRWTPPAESPEDPPYVTAKVEQENKERTQVTVTINNYLTHPPHLETALSARYYIDASELIAAGQTISAVKGEVYYDESKTTYNSPAKLTGPLPYDEAKGIYYFEISWVGAKVTGKRDFQFGILAAQDSSWKSNWDPTNDWSRTGLSTTAATKTKKITVYRAGTKIFGDEPGNPGPSASASPSVSPSVSPSRSIPVSPSSSVSSSPSRSASSSPSRSASSSPAASPSSSASASQSGSGSCKVTFKTDSWATGFSSTVTVANTGRSAVANWTLGFTLGTGQTLASVWGATVTGTTGAVTAKGMAWNGSIAAGATVSFGYQGTLAGAGYTAPTAVALNGTGCTIG